MTNSARKLSLVVLSFQRYGETTGPCLSTLARALDDARVELILVDNGSDDGSAEHCAAWSREHPSAHYLPMPRDLGYAGGRNMGVSIATGEWVCLVDPDALFPPGALEALLGALDHAPAKVAMLGPVTNAAGNGQRLPLPDLPPARAVIAGTEAMRTPTGLFTPSYRIDFFCVAIQRSVWNQLGGLDTGVGLGGYEGFDFSLRLRAAGREQAIAEDVFIAHAGGATSSPAAQDERQALMRRHQKSLRERHPQARFDPACEGNAQALRHLVAAARARGWTPGLRERAAWRYAALLRDADESPLQRLRWRWRTRALRRALKTEGIEPRFPNLPVASSSV